MDVTARFSNRVADYVRFRPSYPEAVFDALVARLEAKLPRVAADIGSGTGIFSRGLLARGFEVHAVEPNPQMRREAEQALGAEPRFHSWSGRAEATGLPAESVALVVAAQAFHWFDAGQCRSEWRRVLLPGGSVGLVWNQRRLESPFMAAYEALMQRLVDAPIRHSTCMLAPMLSKIRKPFRGYAPAEQAPLAGYGAAMLVYAVGLAFALAITRKKRAQPGWADVALLGIGTHKLSRIITKDFVTAPLRAPFTRRQAAEGAAEVHDEPRGGALRRSIGYLVTCPYCLGVWISTGLNTLLLLRPVQTRFTLQMLTANTLSDFLHLAYSRLNESRKAVAAERRELERGAGCVARWTAV